MDKYALALSENNYFWLHHSNRLSTERFLYNDNSPMSDWELVEFTLDEAVDYVKSHPKDKLDIVFLKRG